MHKEYTIYDEDNKRNHGTAIVRLHDVTLTNDEYHYVSELLANRSVFISEERKKIEFHANSLLGASDGMVIDAIKLNNEDAFIESLLSEKFISI